MATHAESADVARSQFSEAKGPTKVTCAECSACVPIRFLFRCLYCDLWFCEICAEEHFGESLESYRKRRERREFSSVYTVTGNKVHYMKNEQTGMRLTVCGRHVGAPAGTQRVVCQICLRIRAKG